MYLPMGGSTQKAIEQTADNTSATATNTDRAADAGEKTVPLIKKADGAYGSSSAEWDKLIQRESGGKKDIVQGVQDANSGGNEASGLFQIAKGTWAANGGKEFAETAGQATAEQQAKIAARIFEKSGAQPWGNREDEGKLREGLTNGSANSNLAGSGSNQADQQKYLDEARKTNKKLDEAIKTVENRNSSEEEVIRALQDIDDTIATTEDPDVRDSLKQIRDNTMSSRGIKEYDPKEGKSEDPLMDTVGLMQNVLGVYRTIEQGFESARATFELLVRGF
jgi:hypothetical protein